MSIFLYQKSVEVWKDVSKTISFIKIGLHVPQGNQSLAKSRKEGILELLFPRKKKKKSLEVIFSYQFLSEMVQNTIFQLFGQTLIALWELNNESDFDETSTSFHTTYFCYWKKKIVVFGPPYWIHERNTVRCDLLVSRSVSRSFICRHIGLSLKPLDPEIESITQLCYPINLISKVEKTHLKIFVFFKSHHRPY